MSRYNLNSKDDVQFHSEGMGHRPAHPALNIKVGYRECPCDDDIMGWFNCEQEDAERAAQFAMNMAQRQFFDEAEAAATEIFDGWGAKVYSEGRSGGWLVVHNLPDFESWDAVMFGKWKAFANRIDELMSHYLDADLWKENIEANRWAEPGSEEYNFVDRPDGTVVCIAEANRAAEKARREVLGEVHSGGFQANR